MKKVLFASSECVPFIKTGGLADVVGSLPKCFDKRYYDVRVILPKYSCMKQQWKDMMQYKTHFYMDFAGQSQYVGVLECVYDGVTFYFIDNEHYFTGDKPYTEHHWDIEKFMYFDRAVLSALPLLDFRPDVIHCHDWQTGLIPVYLHDSFAGGDFFRGIKTVMTIHNLKFQGNDGVEQFKRISGLSDYYFTIDKLRTGVDGNMLKGGLVYADAITTVSNTYAEEIKTQFYGEGLDGLMRARANDLFRWFAGKYPDRVSANIYYSEEMSHRIYASADAFLMPSLFEPCGLSQLMSLRYGTLPIVRETGGLRDTVQPFNQFERTGTGFSFANYNAHEMYNTVMFAKYIFDDRRDEWNGLIKSAMAQDFSWQASANKYQEMYDWLIG